MPLLTAFLIMFAFAVQGTNPKEESPASQRLPRYFDLANGAVVDSEELYVWAHVSSGPMNGEAADAYVRTLQTAGYSDWRVPSQAELRQLFDKEQCHSLAGQQSVSVCVPPAIVLTGPAVWIHDADGFATAIMDLGNGEVHQARAGETAVVLPVRKTTYE